MTTEQDAPTGLRERRRRQTEEEISEAALDLFERRGVAGCTVDDIAEAAQVSPRTFFRYFATKERAALVAHRDVEDTFQRVVTGLRPDEPLLPQIETLWVEMLEQLRDGQSPAGRQMLRLRLLMRTEPSLRLAALHLDEERRDEFIALVAGVVGTTPDDLDIRVTVETAGTLVGVALDRWADAVERRTTGPTPDLVATYRDTCAAFRRLCRG
ncbi:TetR/AcrR family transcriptional regulator [Nocardioides alkalitolerans]|uniref:TetR/AcrR family transcriptional regulator n=1 Tax=Nocardioides alkalitolerans TaxID=281714 RepID=UPI000415FC85|nr:TetR family transcriptional regulator [Nocardioides alkalitolerans]